MFRRKADRLQEELAHEDPLAEAGRPRRRVAAAQAAKKRDRRSDLTVAALGITLGLICALFPWYIQWLPNAIWKTFDLFVGLIQAFIFALLTILYFSQSMEMDEHH